MHILIADVRRREEKALKEANQYRGIFSSLSKMALSAYTLLVILHLVERNYYMAKYNSLKDTILGMGMVAIPLCILLSVGRAIFLWRKRRR